LNSGFTEYWIVRRSLSSGGHSADPLADDDTHVVVTPGGDSFSCGHPNLL